MFPFGPTLTLLCTPCRPLKTSRSIKPRPFLSGWRRLRLVFGTTIPTGSLSLPSRCTSKAARPSTLASPPSSSETKFFCQPIWIVILPCFNLAVLYVHPLTSIAYIVILEARLSQFSPIIATASPHNEALFTSLSTTHVIHRSLSASAIGAGIAKITGGKPVEFVYDAILLPSTQAFAYEVLAPCGALLLTLAPQIPEDKKKADDNTKIMLVFAYVHTSGNRKLGIEQYSRLTN